MKSLIIKANALVLALLMVRCDTDFVNPNSPTDDQILNTREGLLALSVGVLQLYSTDGLRFVLETPAVTTREVATNITLVNYLELEEGGTSLLNSNGHLSRLWATMLRVNQMCSSIISNVENVTLSTATANSIEAHALFFKALTIGNLAQNFEQVVIDPSINNDAQFVTRQAGFEAAIGLLQQAENLLNATPVSDEFDQAVLQGNIDLENSVQAYLARYNLFAGEYVEAVTAALNVDVSIASDFVYDSQNANPIFGGGVFNVRPRDNFGTSTDFSTDGRLSFYTSTSADQNLNGLEIEEFAAGSFFSTSTSSIPVYMPGEMQLIVAESNVRKASPDLTAATAAIDAIRTKTNDTYGVNAGLAVYTGTISESALLDEIYTNRRAELFLTGVSLEDSRRFGIAAPSGTSGVFSEPRNRNFYPYPQRERSNNANTPDDPNL